MRVLKPALFLAAAVTACMLCVCVAYAADYTVEAGQSVNVTLSVPGDGGIDGEVVVSGGAGASYTASEAGGVTGGGRFYLYNSNPKTVTVTVTAPAGAAAGTVYTVIFYYDEYGDDGYQVGSFTDTRTVEVIKKETPNPPVGGGGGSGGGSGGSGGSGGGGGSGGSGGSGGGGSSGGGSGGSGGSGGGGSTVSEPVDPVVTEEPKIDTAALNAKIKEAEALDGDQYPTAQWRTLQSQVESAREKLESKDQNEINEAVKALNEAIEKLTAVQYTDLLSALARARALGENEEFSLSQPRLWIALFDALNAGNALMETGADQTTVDAQVEQLNNLTSRLLEGQGTDYCNVKSHDLWPVLFIVSLTVNVVCLVVIVVVAKGRIRREQDSTPLVDYDIDDDA